MNWNESCRKVLWRQQEGCIKHSNVDRTQGKILGLRWTLCSLNEHLPQAACITALKNQLDCISFEQKFSPWINELNVLTLRGKQTSFWLEQYIQESHDSLNPETASFWSDRCIVVYCKLTRLLYTSQKLSHWHLTKSTTYWLREWACTAMWHFPTIFWELRLGVVSDIIVIAKSELLNWVQNPSTTSQADQICP